MTYHFIWRLRNPQYTGENRCYPCTLINVVFTILAATALAAVAIELGVGMLTVGLLSVYLRGYLVPKTPELSKRYLPEWVLKWFGKTPDVTTASQNRSAEQGSTSVSVHPERVLSETGLLAQAGDDLRLVPAARVTLLDSMRDIRSEPAAHVARSFSVDTVDLRRISTGITVVDDGAVIAQWTSEAAMIADLAIEKFLSAELDNWKMYSPEMRGQIVSSLRILVESCPQCESNMEFVSSELETCCSVIQTNEYRCEQCEKPLVEFAS